MDIARNNYTEVCVYCHTPHGANSQIDAPLWNRTINTGTYEIYDKATTLNQPVSQPGPASLTCLSCHDGTISIDSIINMPGSGYYNKAQETAVNVGFLDSWPGPGPTATHYVLGPETNNAPGRCTICHNSNIPTIPDYTNFTLGTDLRDDHPIGILFPDTFEPGVDFNQPVFRAEKKLAFFDVDGDAFPDKEDVRLYDSGGGYEVECASCHDPHGVPSLNFDGEFNPSFLRVSNGNAQTSVGRPSGLCLTCHIK